MTALPPRRAPRGAPELRRALKSAIKTDALSAFVQNLSAAEIVTLKHDWLTFARADQLPPKAAEGGGDWNVWLILGGRGAGKTRAGAEWSRGMVFGRKPFAREPAGRIALVGETFADVRDVMIEGQSGLLAAHPRAERPDWIATRRLLQWPNGATGHVFSAEEPDSLRGPQFHAAWCDELAKWRYAEEAWDMLQFGMRLGEKPRQLVTTTPRPLALLKRLAADPLNAVTRVPTERNALNLAPDFLRQIVKRYEGTRLGRQELDAEFVEEREDAMFKRSDIEASRVDKAPELARICVAIDPPAASHKRAASCGIIACGIARDGIVYVLEDATIAAARPGVWAARAVELYHRLEADALIAEVNQGGAMVESVIASVDPSVPVRAMHASRGKHLRAEPVAALYPKGLIKHAGAFPALEDELCAFGPGGLEGGRSPDRLDALVWAVTHLALEPAKGRPRVRGV